MKYSDWKLLTNDEKQQVKLRHRPHVKAASIFSALFLLMLLVFVFRVLKNRRIHVNRKPNTEEAFAIAKTFVKAQLKLPATAVFPSKYQQATADTAHNLYQVTAKVKTQNVTGKQVEYAWNIALAYTGGDWADQSSWTVKKLTFTPAL